MTHRIAQLEAERDTAVREAASAAGKAGAERETAAARQREFEELKQQRADFQRELIEMKVSPDWLTGLANQPAETNGMTNRKLV